MKLIASIVFFLPILFSGSDSSFSTKTIESNMVKVNENLYANKFETTNREYKDFLEWAKTSKNEDILKASQINMNGWPKISNDDFWSGYVNDERFGVFPVLNISYDGAVNYCEWLSQKYNTSKKRKYNKVVFRLPTKMEWETMAKAGRSNIKFPWGSPYLTNKNGNHLANYFRVGNSRMKIDINNRGSIVFDGIKENPPYIMTTAVNQFPHGPYELHNLSGNAAEMVAEKGSTKGGSYASSGYYLTIDAEDEFKGFEKSPYVGFRYVMEVIEK